MKIKIIDRYNLNSEFSDYITKRDIDIHKTLRHYRQNTDYN